MEQQKVVDRELYYTDEFLPKFTERLVIFLDCLKNKTEPNESDWSVVEEVHRIWQDNRLGWMKSTFPEADTSTATQPTLFDTSVNTTEVKSNIPDNFDDARDQILNGTNLEEVSAETKKEEK